MCKAIIRKFYDDESGMVTADWVVLTASVMVVVTLLVSPVIQGVDNAGETIAYAVSIAGDADEGADVPDPASGPGNPGNAKSNGNAGENPNGKGNWGSGSFGNAK